MPFTRIAGSPTMTPTDADSAAALLIASKNGHPRLSRYTCVYAPTPRNAAWPSEASPVKPANTIKPSPAIE
jgi:hypothetical protein